MSNTQNLTKKDVHNLSSKYLDLILLKDQQYFNDALINNDSFLTIVKSAIEINNLTLPVKRTVASNKYYKKLTNILAKTKITLDNTLYSDLSAMKDQLN
jgi:hypothetical protein